ncbi:MAG: hypothetical protein L0Y56_10565, partial [Nitrospira sp.]|nr:hypothetical protein [Nitrospira sp.]
MEALEAVDKAHGASSLTPLEKRIEPEKAIQSLLKSKTAVVGLFIFFMIVSSALLAPHLAPHDPTVQDINNRLKPPVWDSKGSQEHLLGTD